MTSVSIGTLVEAKHRFVWINARSAKGLTPEVAASLAEVEAMDDGTL